MRIMVTGSAGFIGSAVCKYLLERRHEVLGIDNHCDYYDVNLKGARVQNLSDFENYEHRKKSIENLTDLSEAFTDFSPQRVINLAAQAGVRYSIENPSAYIQSNLVGFSNILECCRRNSVEHLVYASSSSVYGANKTMPFSVHHNVDHPLSLYAATKKSNELMAHSYSSLFGLRTSGLRFFTVYGPWGRPDMALFKFTKSIIDGDEIEVYNNGQHKRDFTYIDDIVEGIVGVCDHLPEQSIDWNGLNPDPASSSAPWRVYNIGNGKPVKLMDFIHLIEQRLQKSAKIKLLPMQPGDVQDTCADTSSLKSLIDFQPKTDIEVGVNRFIDWYLEYYSCD